MSKTKKATIAPQPAKPPVTIHCAYTELADPNDLRPHPKNINHHPKAQVKLLAKLIIHQGFRHPVVVSKLSGLIVAGHGRREAGIILGCQVPVDYQDFESEDQELQHLIADNQIAELSQPDLVELKEHLEVLQSKGLDLELFGMMEAECRAMLDKANRPTRNVTTNELIEYRIIFDSQEQNVTWFEFLAWLKDQFPTHQSVGARLIALATRLKPNTANAQS